MQKNFCLKGAGSTPALHTTRPLKAEQLLTRYATYV